MGEVSGGPTRFSGTLSGSKKKDFLLKVVVVVVVGVVEGMLVDRASKRVE